MRLLVDAMNVLHAWTAGPAEDKAGAVAALARAIARSRYASEEVLLIVDGVPPAEADSLDGRFEAFGASVYFSGADQEADDLIERILGEPGPTRETVVVSADRRLGRAAHRRGARSMSAGTFIGILMEDGARRSRGEAPASAAGDPGASGVLESSEVEAWLGAFGVGGDRPEPDRERRVPDPPEPDEPRAGSGVPPARDWTIEAQREWPGLSDEDLDMEKWLGDADGPHPR